MIIEVLPTNDPLVNYFIAEHVGECFEAIKSGYFYLIDLGEDYGTAVPVEYAKEVG